MFKVLILFYVFWLNLLDIFAQDIKYVRVDIS